MCRSLCATLLLAGCAAAKAPAPMTTETPPPAPAPLEDRYLWLEAVEGERQLAWVREQNAKSTAELQADPRFSPLQERLRAILDSKDQIPYASKQGRWYYNFWRDQQHPRGLWRRVATLADYRRPDPPWETVLDLDALGAAERVGWVWHGALFLYPDHQRCLLQLSRGGSDAQVVREFDLVKKAFVEGGFALPEAKSNVSWKDPETIYVGTDFGPGSLTDSGYPRTVREWRRGTPLAEARQIYQCAKADVACGAYRVWDHGRARDWVYRTPAFFKGEYWLLLGDERVRLDVPDSANVDTWDDQLTVILREDWTVGGRTWPKGSLLLTGLDAFLAGGRDFTQLFAPAPNRSLIGTSELRSAILVNELEDVHNRLWLWTRRDGAWSRTPIDAVRSGTVSAAEVERHDSDDYWLITTDFTQPTTLSLAAPGRAAEPLKRLPAFFDAQGLLVEQQFATSRDGMRVPYFQVWRPGASAPRPALLYGYGGFEVSMLPHYGAIAGAAWLEQGGVYVEANIRGGGEYGPGWHQAALQEKRQVAFDDFAAVAEDLIARKVTTPRQLGIMGGSNGGLLVGVLLTQRPELFGAVVCQVPLLDMKRYSHLLAGASWIAEYGDPDKPEEWAWISRYSPYQNLRVHRTYPRTLFTTSTRDDRVHPGHARKMVAKMAGLGHDVLYYENIEGGHGGAADNQQRALLSALEWIFLARQLGL